MAAEDLKPHFIDDGRGLRPASTEEIAPLVAHHATHDGIAFFATCPRCQAGKVAGRYPQWFTPEGGGDG